MSPQDVPRLVRALRFRAFRIRLAGGCALDVRHPGMVCVGRHGILAYES